MDDRNDFIDFAYRNRKCGPPHRPKKRYETKRDAKNAARDLKRLDGDRMDAYQCPICEFWHIGHHNNIYHK